jgi:hypothetical protein
MPHQILFHSSQKENISAKNLIGGLELTTGVPRLRLSENISAFLRIAENGRTSAKLIHWTGEPNNPEDHAQDHAED